MNFKKVILDSVNHNRLKKLSDFFNAKPKDLRSSASIQHALKRLPNISEQDLIGRLHVEELKKLCCFYDILSKGSRAELISLLLQKHEKLLIEKHRHPAATAKHRNGNDHFVAIDFETADHPRDSACAVALVTVKGSKIVARSHFLIKPPRKTFSFTHIHGLSWADVKDAKTFEEIWPEILPKIESAEFLVAHNASFDRSVLDACCRTYNLATPTWPFQCTVEWARKIWNLRPTKLPNVCEFLSIHLQQHHNALSDAEACAKIMIKIRKEFRLTNPHMNGTLFPSNHDGQRETIK